MKETGDLEELEHKRVIQIAVLLRNCMEVGILSEKLMKRPFQ